LEGGALGNFKIDFLTVRNGCLVQNWAERLPISKSIWLQFPPILPSSLPSFHGGNAGHFSFEGGNAGHVWRQNLGSKINKEMIENGSQRGQKMSKNYEKSIPGVLEWAGRWLEWAGRWGPGRAFFGQMCPHYHALVNVLIKTCLTMVLWSLFKPGVGSFCLAWAGRWGPGRALGCRTGRKAEKVKNDGSETLICYTE